MILLALVMVASQPARLSPGNQAVRATLRRAVEELESRAENGLENEKLAFRQFERLAPRSNIAVWQRLQRRIPPTRSGSLDLAFVLAYYGVDYERNLRRLLLPYRRWQRGIIPIPKTEAAAIHEATMLDTLPYDLELLFRKHRDGQSLSTLLVLRLDGGPGELQADAISHLWGDDHAARMLRVAAGSKVRRENIEAALEMDSDDSRDRKEIAAELRRLCHHPDTRVAKTAREVLSNLKRALKRDDR
jgi:hypothetical protein